MPVPDPKRLLALLQEFINAPSWDESRRAVESTPELLTDEADAVMAHLLDQYRDDPQAIRILTVHRDLLRRCRDEGVEAAFAALTQESEEGSDDLPPIAQAIVALMEARSPAEVLEAIREHPALLGDEADKLIQEGIENARRAGEEGMARHIEERHATVSQVRELGASPEQLSALAEAGEQIAARLDDLPEESRRILAGVSSPEELEAALREHPEIAEALARAAGDEEEMAKLADG